MGSNMAENHPIAFRFARQGARARRAADPRRPALQPHLGAGRHLCRHPLRHRYRLPRRPDQLHHPARALLQGVRAGLHQRRRADRRATSGTPKTSTACSPASTREARQYDSKTWQYRGDEATGHEDGHSAGARERDGGRSRKAGAGAKHGRRRAEERQPRRSADGPDPAGPALRLPDRQAPLRALHAGDGGRALRLHAPRTSWPWPRRSPRTRAASGPPPSATRWAGPSTPSACR